MGVSSISGAAHGDVTDYRRNYSNQSAIMRAGAVVCHKVGGSDEDVVVYGEATAGEVIGPCMSSFPMRCAMSICALNSEPIPLKNTQLNPVCVAFAKGNHTVRVCFYFAGYRLALAILFHSIFGLDSHRDDQMQLGMDQSVHQAVVFWRDLPPTIEA